MIVKRYLDETHMKGFDKYKYNSVDKSVLSVYVMHPFWNYSVQYFPTWMAPNLITFIGFLLTVFNFFLIGYYDYDFSAADVEVNPVPRWVWAIASINIFLAYQFDGIDGKQARRTGTSGPLGELFDHGLDSYSTVLVPIYMFSLFGRSDLTPLRMFFITLNIFLNFYLPHWEKYNTGVMYLPLGYDFLMWGVTGVLGLSAIAGPAIWKMPVFGIKPCYIFEFVLYVSPMLSSHPIILYNIYKSYRDKTGKMRTFSEAMRPLIPLTGLLVLSTLWVQFSVNSIIDLEPRLYFILCGTLFSNICCRLIVAQMSDTRMDAWNNLLNLLIIATTIGCFPFYENVGLKLSEDFEIFALIALSIVVTIAHLHYGTCVVREMCQHFKIKCFKIPFGKSSLPYSLKS